jgi:putative DNA methylase
LEKRLIEEWLPLRDMNVDAAAEGALVGRDVSEIAKTFQETFGVKPAILGPRLRNLHPYVARRPSSTSRILSLAALCPSNADHETFSQAIGKDQLKKTASSLLFYINPDVSSVNELIHSNGGKSAAQITACDPMSGGGAIPLEMLRLGLKTVASDYNPLAYLILKGTIEYPAKFGEPLYLGVVQAARDLAKFAEEELARYYPNDSLRYVVARGYTCPEPTCKGLIPLIHMTRLKRNGPYLKFEFNSKDFHVSITESETKYDHSRCPYCHRPFNSKVAIQTWVEKHKSLLKTALGGSLAEAKRSLDELRQTHLFLVKGIKGGFATCEPSDIRKFEEAYLDLCREAKDLSDFIPTDPIPPENEVFRPLKDMGIEYWYELYNPRQLLILSKVLRQLTVYARDSQARNREMWYAIQLYLALALGKIADYSNIASMWNNFRGRINRLGDQYAGRKSVGLGLEYGESNIARLDIRWALEPDLTKPSMTHGGICPVLKVLTDSLAGLGNRVKVTMADAKQLKDLVGVESVDLINVDPPYLSQHNYSDLSEFYWQLLRLALKPAIEQGYMFNTRANGKPVECLVSGWAPVLATVPRDNEIIVRRSAEKPTSKSRKSKSSPHTNEWYNEQMWEFFESCKGSLRDDGILVLWFTHTDPAAWENVLSALYSADFVVSKVWTIRTESSKRLIATLGGTAFFTSLAIIARKNRHSIVVGEENPRELALNDEITKTMMASATEAMQSALDSGASEEESYVMGLAGAIAGATRIRNPALDAKGLKIPKLDDYTVGEKLADSVPLYMVRSKFFKESLYPIALYLGTERLLEAGLKERLKKQANLADELAEATSREILMVEPFTKAYLLFWLLIRFSERPIVGYDFAEKICKVLGIHMRELAALGLAKKEGRGEESSYRILFGRENFETVHNRVEILDKTTAGKAVRIIKSIVDSPSYEQTDKVATRIRSLLPVSRRETATAVFMLSTSTAEELKSLEITDYSKPFIIRVLRALFGE